MNTFYISRSGQEQQDTFVTSAGKSMKAQNEAIPRFFGSSPYYIGTASSQSILDWYLQLMEKQTASNLSVTYSSPITVESAQVTIHELKKLSGLTWEQLAKIFNVSRRSLHFWASGKPMTPFNEEHLRRLLATIRYIDRGSADINRSALLHAQQGSIIPLDLLIAGKYEEAKRLLGAGKAVEKPKLKPLSPEAIASRFPPSPEDLVGALQNPVHREVGRSRPAKTTRSRKRSGGK
jgi:transcriptional regulator with XRE-family HTH domain